MKPSHGAQGRGRHRRTRTQRTDGSPSFREQPAIESRWRRQTPWRHEAPRRSAGHRGSAWAACAGTPKARGTDRLCRCSDGTGKSSSGATMSDRCRRLQSLRCYTTPGTASITLMAYGLRPASNSQHAARVGLRVFSLSWSTGAGVCVNQARSSRLFVLTTARVPARSLAKCADVNSAAATDHELGSPSTRSDTTGPATNPPPKLRPSHADR